MARGLFIALEGIDGAGTSTQRERIAARIVEDCGIPVHTTCQPSAGPVGSMIRRALRGEHQFPPAAMALLFAADRLDHMASEIEPRLRAGDVVISDRYVLSSLAYQSVDNDVGWIAHINKQAPAPDVTVLVDIEPDLAARRRGGREQKQELYEVDDFQRRVAQNYRELSTHPGVGPCVTIDGSPPVNKVTDAIMQDLKPYLAKVASS